MKQLIRFSLMLLVFLLPATAAAYDFEVDGIYYNIRYDNQAVVTCGPHGADEFIYYVGNVTIPTTVTYDGTIYSVISIDDNAFEDCTRLTSIEIPNSVTLIGHRAFYGCSNLTSVIIGNSVTEIDESAFSGCTSLTEVYSLALTPPTTIWAFDNYNATLYVHMEAVNAYKAANGWEYFTNIIGIEYEPPVDTFIVDGIYYRGTYLNVVTVVANEDDEAEYYGDVVIPDSVTYEGHTFAVKGIEDNAFMNCSGLTSVVIGNSVTSIGSSAFSSCSSLKSVTVGKSVTFSGNFAFSGCNAITDLIWNARNCYNFIDTYNIERLTIGSEVAVLPNCFMSHSKITSLTIPNSVTSIGLYAFEGCTGLTSVTIGNSVKSIDWSAFQGCTGLTNISVASGNTTYDSRNSCNAIIETASNTLIFGCMSTIIPNSVTSIGNCAFEECTALTSIVIPNSVTALGRCAFMSCTGLVSVTIPNSVTSIDDNAFRSCTDLVSVTIPNSVTSIGNYVFYSCDSLKDVFSYISDPSAITMGSYIFNRYPNNYEARTLHVPIGSLEAYQADSKWSKYFGNIVEMEPETILVASIELDVTETEITEGETLQLTATVLPEDATDKTVTWASSDETIVTVDENGLVTAISTGTAAITATTADGSDLSASCVVNATSSVTPPFVENLFVVTNISAKRGDVVVIPVTLLNDQTFAAFQTDVFLPEGFSIAKDEDDEYIVTLSGRLTSDHVLMTNDANNGSVRILCYTPNTLPINGSEGELFYITVKVPEDAEGLYTIALRNSLLTTTEYQEISIPDAEGQMDIYAFIPGDVNDSRTVNVTDIVVAAQYILDQNPEPFVFEAADMNGDGNVTVTDIMLIAYLINHPTMNVPKRMPALKGGNDRMSGEGVTLMADETRNVSIQLKNEMYYTAFQLDLTLPAGLIASNFQLTDRAGNHAFDVSTLSNGKTRVLCYSPAIEVIEGHEGVLLTFDVTATDNVESSIIVDDIEMVTANCQTILMNNFTIDVNSTTSVNELSGVKAVAREDYFNLAGQQIDRPSSGVTLVVTTYTDGTRSTTKVIK